MKKTKKLKFSKTTVRVLSGLDGVGGGLPTSNATCPPPDPPRVLEVPGGTSATRYCDPWPS